MTENYCGLVANGLDLTDGPYEALSDDATFGNPEPLTTSMRGLLQDGSTVTVSGHDNRDMFFRVKIKAPDGRALAEAEAALVRATTGAFPLAWAPPDGWGPTTIFDVQHCALTFLFDGLDELRCERTFGLSMTALPFGRSVNETVAEATAPAASSGTVVDSCDSASGWTARTFLGSTGPLAVDVDATTFVTAPGSLTVTGAGYTWTPNDVEYRFLYLEWSRLAAFTQPAGSRYFTVRVRDSLGSFNNPRLTYTRDGNRVFNVAALATEAMPGGWTKITWPLDAGTISDVLIQLTISKGYPPGAGPATISAWIDDVQQVGLGTTKQSVRTIDVASAVRTPGSLEVAGPTTLGHALVFTAEDLDDGFRPDLSRWAVEGTPTSDATAITGIYTSPPTAYSDAGGPNFEVPVSTLRAGGYSVLARMATGAAVTVSIDATLRIGGTNVGVIQETFGKAPGLGASTWQVIALGTLHLPPTMVPQGSAAVVRLRVKASAAGVKLDEVWLFPSSGDLTVVDCGTGAPSAAGSSSRLWLDSPTVAQPHGGVWRGIAADRSDSRAAGLGLIALGRHSFVPPRTLVFLATSNAGGATVALRHYARWHTNAAS